MEEKLLILSEVDRLGYLQSKGIYPDEFYTDFDLFKNKSVTFNNANVIIIFLGSCRFSKRLIIDMIKTLEQRAESEIDKGIKSVTVFSDCFIPALKKYYKFDTHIDNVSEVSGWKVKVDKSPILKNMYTGVKDTQCRTFLRDTDKGDVTRLRNEYKNATSLDESLRTLIKKPSFK